jgi:alpha-D-ribose 1-methylphosphonate 5-triphosphate synthase subunit PhnI
MYVAVKGGEAAIDAAHRLLAETRRGDRAVPELSLEQIEQQLGHAVDRVMAEGSLHDRELAALAIKQAAGDLVEAVFLVRAYRTTLPRFGATRPLDTSAMTVRRRISATFKDLPGGQILGPTFDYTHRLLDFTLAEEDTAPPDVCDPDAESERPLAGTSPLPRVVDLLDREGLIESETPDPESRRVGDLTREPLAFPTERDVRLQSLARADEGFLLALGELGFPVEIASITVTECQMVNQFRGSHAAPPQFTRGYGLAFGHAERKAMAMALVDRALRAEELDEETGSPAQDQEFVLYHGDNVEAAGFVQHLKLPHYVDFQSELVLLRTLRAQAGARPQS